VARAVRRDRRAPSAARPDVTLRDGPILVIDGDPRPELARRGIVLHPSVGALPLPVREPVAVRAVHVENALAGSDVVTAMTGDLHRRALARVGAARRVREWVGVALEAARDAVAEADDAVRPMRDGESAPPLRLAGQLWPLEERGGPAAAPDFAVASAEHRVHAGTLADAGVDLLRIERMETVAESEASTLAARETGLETWTSIALSADGVTLVSGESLTAWLSVVVPLAPAAVILEASTWDGATAGLTEAGRLLRALDPSGSVALGAALPPGEPASPSADRDGTAVDASAPRAAALIDAGATILSAGTDGSPRRVASLRSAAERAEDARRRGHDEKRDRLAAWAGQAAIRSLPGSAVWVVGGPSDGSTWGGGMAPHPVRRPGSSPDGALPLPAGFEWHVVDGRTLGQLPAGRYRLAIVAAEDGLGGPALAARIRQAVDAMEAGAWLLVEGTEAGAALRAEERLADLEPARASGSGVPSWLARRRH
jgi:S-methylmethionine-dependent homocysteine/selenocysteine methylase